MMLKLNGDTYATLLEYAKQNEIPLATLISKTMDNIAMKIKNNSTNGDIYDQKGTKFKS